ncbi:late embryogenesis abundant protein 1 isoform X1 [Durio zibethinus]|uniref:Late embryogenesis abundant protein 1 isoform X1 n=1 Tax=Durio zibethinus TaxID=66656 RepID=A0A6P6A8C6_DURZI|nr:late embryogenesis abundant protein 1 isoform X1 [Durio zibethinus]
MSNLQQSFNAGQTQGQTQGRTEQMIQSTKDTANAARDQATNATQSAQESAQQGQQQTAGFLQQVSSLPVIPFHQFFCFSIIIIPHFEGTLNRQLIKFTLF